MTFKDRLISTVRFCTMARHRHIEMVNIFIEMVNIFKKQLLELSYDSNKT